MIKALLAALQLYLQPFEMAAAASRELTIPYTRNTANPRHFLKCRTAPRGCHERLFTFALLAWRAGRAHGVDPWILWAMAYKETRFNPRAIGRGGEYGVVQISPKGIYKERGYELGVFRTHMECVLEWDECQAGAFDLAASELARMGRKCPKVIRAQYRRDHVRAPRIDATEVALTGWNRGKCQLTSSYARAVFRHLKKLRDP